MKKQDIAGLVIFTALLVSGAVWYSIKTDKAIRAMPEMALVCDINDECYPVPVSELKD